MNEIPRYDKRSKDLFIRTLLDCDTMKNSDGRDQVVKNPRDVIPHHYHAKEAAYTDVESLVDRCLQFDLGVEELVDALGIYERGTRY